MVNVLPPVTSGGASVFPPVLPYPSIEELNYIVDVVLPSTYVPRLGNAFSTSALVGGAVVITLNSPYGLRASDGSWYFDQAGAAPGEAAELRLEDDGSYSLIHPTGATA